MAKRHTPQRHHRDDEDSRHSTTSVSSDESDDEDEDDESDEDEDEDDQDDEDDLAHGLAPFRALRVACSAPGPQAPAGVNRRFTARSG